MKIIPMLATSIAILYAVILTLTLFLAAAPLLVVDYGLYRAATQFFQGSFMALEAYFLETLYGIRLKVTGASITRGASLVIMNHRTRTDWMMVWPMFAHLGLLQDLHFMAKMQLRGIPFVGWCMQAARHIFLARRWDADEKAMTEALMRMAGSPDEPFALLMFPEGTDLSPKNIAKSQEFAQKGGLPLLEHVLYPRTRGFLHTLSTLRRAAHPVETVYDVTIAYEGHVPTSESALVSGTVPSAVHAHVTAYPVATLPHDDAGLEAWLKARFEAKEEILAQFYAARGTKSLESTSPEAGSPSNFTRVPSVLTAFAIAWLAIVLLIVIFFPFVAACYALASIGTAVTVQVLFGGMDAIERRLTSLGSLAGGRKAN